jgi:hypothetical protein
MSDEKLRLRIERFERTVATCICTISFLFGAQCLGVALSIPIFEKMFADFGSALPGVTTFVFQFRPLWLLLAVGLPLTTLILSRKAPATFSVIFATACGLLLFLIAQFLTGAAFLPIFQLAGVASGTAP